MIRPFEPTDTEAVIRLWLEASRLAHDFISSSYWEGKCHDMQTLYLPESETYILCDESTREIAGFVSLAGDYLAALFVAPDHQGRQIGTKLLDYVKNRRKCLTLHVYEANRSAAGFYLSRGFHTRRCQYDPDTGQPELVMVWNND